MPAPPPVRYRYPNLAAIRVEYWRLRQTVAAGLQWASFCRVLRDSDEICPVSCAEVIAAGPGKCVVEPRPDGKECPHCGGRLVVTIIGQTEDGRFDPSGSMQSPCPLCPPACRPSPAAPADRPPVPPREPGTGPGNLPPEVRAALALFKWEPALDSRPPH